MVGGAHYSIYAPIVLEGWLEVRALQRRMKADGFGKYFVSHENPDQHGQLLLASMNLW